MPSVSTKRKRKRVRLKEEPCLNDQQLAIVDYILNEKGSLNVVARAGCGKTYTLLNGIIRTAVEKELGSVAIMAFNKAIANEFKAKLELMAKELNDPRYTNFMFVDAATVHSFGFRAWRKVAPRVKLDDKKLYNLIDRRAEVNRDPYSIWAKCGPAIRKLVSLAKQSAVGVNGKVEDMAQWATIMDHHAINDFDPMFTETDVIESAISIYNESLLMNYDVIDFADMILAPIINNLKFYPKDFVLIDEAQDTNAARRILAKGMLAPKTGRMVAVGDDKQAIYGFCHPPKTKIMTPQGSVNIEDLKIGDPVIVANTSGDISGWSGNKCVLETHKYFHSGMILSLLTNEPEGLGFREVLVTPHHKVPVRISPSYGYYTYLMRRCGIYRVGHCQSYTEGQFMLQLRRKTEKADAVWLLNWFPTKDEAVEHEQLLLRRVKGVSFNASTNEEVSKLPSDEVEALKILAEHGRMESFPLLTDEPYKARIASNGSFITEACNILDGMKIAFYSDNQVDPRKRGRCRQNFNWCPVEVFARQYCGYVYGITVDAIPSQEHAGYMERSVPLYFAGDGNILVHNTGADSDAMQIIKDETGAVELPLTITYRCPKLVVAEANKLVPDLQAHETAPEGIVRNMAYSTEVPVDKDDPEKGVKQVPWFEIEVPDITAAVLCRNTKPLVECAYSMIRSGLGCRVEGRDIGEGLITLAHKWKRIKTLGDLIDKLNEYKENEIAKWTEKGKEERIQPIEDKCDTIILICEKLTSEGKHDLHEFDEFVHSLFGDTEPGEKPKVVTLSTIHRSKGREWDTVYFLFKDTTLPSPYAVKPWQRDQESNLGYVADTRSKRELVFIN